MDITNTKDLPTFYDNIVLIAHKNGCEKYTRSNSFDVGSYGQWFQIGDKLWFWFGLYYKDGACVIEFKDDRNWTPKTNMERIKKIETSGNNYEKPYPEDGWYFFELKDAGVKILSDEKAPKEQQEKVLADFLQEVLSAVGI